MNSKSLVNHFVNNHLYFEMPKNNYHRFMYKAPYCGEPLLNLHLPF